MRTKPCLSATDVKKILEACEAEVLKNSWNQRTIFRSIPRKRESDASPFNPRTGHL
jgi:hypothetical protein